MPYTEDLTNKPVERLKRVHRDLDAKRALLLQRKQNAFEDTKEIIAERERWAKENQSLTDAGVNKVHISGRRYAHNEAMKKLRVQFDNGELTPSTVHKSPPTDLETAKDELNRAGAKIVELESELEKIKSN